MSMKLQNHVKVKRTFEIIESGDLKIFSYRTLETKQDLVKPTQIFFKKGFLCLLFLVCRNVSASQSFLEFQRQIQTVMS